MALITAFWLWNILFYIIGILGLVYLYFRYQFKKLAKRNFPSPFEPTFPSGHFTGLRKKPLDVRTKEIYQSSNEPVLGCYFFTKPVILLRDLEMIKSVLIKDFNNFRNRGLEMDAETEPLAGHLLLMKDQEWRNLRIKLTPTFTSGKMRAMFPTLIDIGNKFNEILADEAKQPKSDIKDLLTRYTMDVIASVAFGLDTKTLYNPKSDFREMTDKILKPSLRTQILGVIVLNFPNFLKMVKIKLFPPEATKFFMDLVKDNMEYREKNGVKRNDFFQQLIELKNAGFVHNADNPENDTKEETQQKFTVEVAAAQAFLFLVAGFETSSSTMQYTLYELALNQKLQDDLRNEIINAKSSNEDGKSFETLMELDLLDRVISETLRKYPVVSLLTRVCEKDYVIPGTNLKVLAGEQIWVSSYGIHYNPDYYPDPKKFDPDRFLPERKAKIPSGAFLPFGDGPRSCIGNRFALMQMKVALSAILTDYIVTPVADTPKEEVEFSTVSVARPKYPIYLKITKNKKDM